MSISALVKAFRQEFTAANPLPISSGSGGTTTSITAIATDGSSGDKTILTPSTGKSLRISALYFVSTTVASITLKAASTAISGTMNLTSHAADYSQPLALGINQAFVINVASAIAINGYVIWWEV